MKPSRHQTSIGRNLLTACVLGCLLAGCTVVGPAAIRSGRLAYNEAITETNNQQMLMVVLNNRYEERGSLLAVASVTANVSVTTITGVQLGFGDSDNFSGNLVPFSTGAIYEENPTISYVPVAGAKYARHLMSPVPVTTVAQLTGTMTNPAYIYTALVESVNGIYNPVFLTSPAEPDPRFNRFVTIMAALTLTRRLHWVENPQQSDSFSVVITDYAPTYMAEVNELLELLGLPVPGDPSAQIILPVSLALDGRASGGIGITTYTVWDLVELLSAAIEIPQEDQQNGVARSYPIAGLAGNSLRIGYAEARPRHAYVAVKHRNVWFYIDEKDQATKQFFRLLASLWSVTIAESASKGSAAPVLTVPVSR